MPERCYVCPARASLQVGGTLRPQALSALQTAQEESAEYLREVEVVGAEYESVQQQNKDLMGRLMDMDTQIGQMRREREAMAEQIRSLEASVQDLQSQARVRRST